MLTRSKIGMLLVIIIGIAVTSTITIIHSQIQRDSTNQLGNKKADDSKISITKRIEENGDPVADYNFSQSNDSSENNLRKTRRDKHDLKSPNLKPGDAKRFELNDNSEPINVGGPWIHSSRRPAFPITEDSFVVIGEVVNAQAFLSNDKTRIFSEFSFKVEDILLENAEQAISTNEIITIERSGGKVRLPSGKMLHRLTEGSPLPKPEKRYLMFLKYDKETNSSYILTGYKLEGGKVIPLDGKGLDDEIVQSLENYQLYYNADENSFLTTVRKAISDFTLKNKEGGK